MVGVGWGGGGGHNLAPNVQTSVNFATIRSYIFTLLRQITFKLDNLTNFKTLLKVVSTGLPYLAHGKS